MFFWPQSEAKRARTQVENLLHLAERVDAYRRDAVSAKELTAMRAAMARAQGLYDLKAGPEALDQASEELHAAMLPCGGDIYPLTFWNDNTQTVLVAAILAIGVRSFFLQPFQIPTNSMYPTYNGMTAYVYTLDQPGPGTAAKVWNFATQGAVHYDVRAPADGEVTLPVQIRTTIDENKSVLVAPYEILTVPKWSRLGLIKEQRREYTLRVGGQAVKVSLPFDFESGFEQAFFQTYFPDLYKEAWNDPPQLLRLVSERGHLQDIGNNSYLVSTGRQVRAGDRVLDFDLRTGDMLVVDRFTYNFIRPSPGDPFVFHTGAIPQLANAVDSQGNLVGDQYYIKRLVGLPGDMLEVRPPALYRNGAPITGAAAFDKNAQQKDNYPGYTNHRLLGPGMTFTVHPDYFFAMGDNSPFSYDSRYWEGVPMHSVVGRAVFIVYPFSFRWGLAR